MKKNIFSGMIILCALLLTTVTASAYEILIDVSPNVLDLQSKGTVVTVHTNLDYDAVNVASVFLNSVPIAFSRVDDLGYFVAKFEMNDFKTLPFAIGEYNKLVFIGQTNDGLAFTGSQEIKVIDISARGKK